MKRILSGMRPTGRLHLGHLVGALRNWVSLQEKYKCFFMVADWHALMSEYKDPKKIQENIIDNCIDWLAVGINPQHSVIFVQSDVQEHLELFMILSNITPLSWLERCPTYKEQLKELKAKDIHTYSFLGYPVLQAADILIYKAEAVPVGEDQLPHLELTREIVRRFNNLYINVFPEPQPLLTETSRFLGLDGRKMSKSYNNTINLCEEPDSIKKKIQNMFTDPKRIKRSDPGHPETCNVHSYFAIFKPQEKPYIDQACRKAEIGCTDCKKRLAEVLIELLTPFRDRRKEILAHKENVNDILEDGAKKAKRVAQSVLDEVKEAIFLKKAV